MSDSFMDINLTRRDIDTLRGARWPEDGQRHPSSATKLVRLGLAYRLGGELFATDKGQRFLDSLDA
jgi:hypothetical protein